MTTYTKIRFRKLPGDRLSIYLDTIYKGRRKTSTLNLVIKKNPNTIEEKAERKKALAFALEVALKKDTELIRQERGLEEIVNENCDFFAYALQYIKDHKTRVDIRVDISAVNKLKEFLGQDKLFFYELSENLFLKFYSYLKSKHKGETPFSYFKKIKRIITSAIRNKLLRNDPTQFIKVPKGKSEQKDVLTLNEITKLWNISCPHREVKYGFLFCCLTGLRYCDIVELKWTDIRSSRVNIIQKKTKNPVTIPLSPNALKILAQMDDETTLVFKLPSHTGCLKILKKWVLRAGISKHITWHCARHSLGTNLTIQGTDIVVTSEILGHKSLDQTARYVRVHEDLKIQAMEKFPESFN